MSWTSFERYYFWRWLCTFLGLCLWMRRRWINAQLLDWKKELKEIQHLDGSKERCSQLWWWRGLIGFMLGRQHGWHYGREQRLQLRHIGYERVTTKCEELEAQNKKLKENLAEYRAASYNLGRGLSSLRDENYDIAEYVMYLEEKLEDKDRELQALRAEQADQLAVTCGVMKRARSELVAHSQMCPMRKSIWICRSGRVWHAEEGCRSMQQAIPVEWSPCSFCASRTNTPYINDLQGRNLLDDLSDWMQTYGQDDLSAGGPWHVAYNGPCQLHSMQPMVTCHFPISPLLPLKMGGLIFSHTGYLVALSRKHCCYFTQLLGGLRGLLSLLCNC